MSVSTWGARALNTILGSSFIAGGAFFTIGPAWPSECWLSNGYIALAQAKWRSAGVPWVRQMLLTLSPRSPRTSSMIPYVVAIVASRARRQVAAIYVVLRPGR